VRICLELGIWTDLRLIPLFYLNSNLSQQWNVSGTLPGVKYRHKKDNLSSSCSNLRRREKFLNKYLYFNVILMEFFFFQLEKCWGFTKIVDATVKVVSQNSYHFVIWRCTTFQTLQIPPLWKGHENSTHLSVVVKIKWNDGMACTSHCA
jgi:hypothetical protein